MHDWLCAHNILRRPGVYCQALGAGALLVDGELLKLSVALEPSRSESIGFLVEELMTARAGNSRRWRASP